MAGAATAPSESRFGGNPGLRRWERRLRSLWFRLQLLVGRLRRLLRAGLEGGARQRRPGRRRVDAEARGARLAEAKHEGLRRLRRQALDDLFAWLDLPLVPGQLLERSDRSGDPVGAFEELIRSLGGDPEAVRRREPEALARLTEAIDLLAGFDLMTARFDSQRRAELEELLYFGDHALVRRLALVLQILDSILADGESLPPDLQAAAYRAFLDDMAGYLEAPLALSPERAEAARKAADRFVKLQRRNEILARRIARDLESLLASKAAALAPRAEEIARRLAALEERWTGEAGLDFAGLESLLGELEKLQARLADLLAEAARNRQEKNREKQEERFDSRARTEQVYRNEREAALAFFGFAVTARPDGLAVKRARGGFFKQNHPDFFQDEAVKAQKTIVCQEANRHYEVLRRELGLI